MMQGCGSVHVFPSWPADALYLVVAYGTSRQAHRIGVMVVAMQLPQSRGLSQRLGMFCARMF